ncbi:FitA-like ribbon-helix-helix domain-containing protein [Pilimelia anulata]|nr:hypothetical protein [Pilimelia anulata]
MTIRNVPDDVYHALAGRAARSGRSLQEYPIHEPAGLLTDRDANRP